MILANEDLVQSDKIEPNHVEDEMLFLKSSNIVKSRGRDLYVTKVHTRLDLVNVVVRPLLFTRLSLLVSREFQVFWNFSHNNS